MEKKNGNHASEEKGKSSENLIYNLYEASLRLRAQALNDAKSEGRNYDEELKEYKSYTKSLRRVIGDKKAHELIKKYPVNHGAGTD
jgi:hypothetical protein